MLTREESLRFDLHPAENPLLGFLWQQVLGQSRTELLEVLSGAHVIIDDPEGKAYAFLESLPGAERRSFSTHRSDRAQYDIPEGYFVSSLLIGYLNNATWFQLEGAPWDLNNHFWQSLGHILDTTEYIMSLMSSNVGPLGTSKYTDRRPLRKKHVAPVHKVCPIGCTTEHASNLRLAVDQDSTSPTLVLGERKPNRPSQVAAPMPVMSSFLADDERQPMSI
jgi:hypothetical protein